MTLERLREVGYCGGGDIGPLRENCSACRFMGGGKEMTPQEFIAKWQRANLSERPDVADALTLSASE